MAGGTEPSDPSATPALRASDAEREHAALQLREHCASGRLTPEELAERLDGAYTARTAGELAALLADLPPDAGTAAAIAAAPGPRARERRLAHRRLLHAGGQMLLVSAACVAVWLATGGDGSFWPKWVLLAAAIRLAFVAWAELGPGAAQEARHGRGGAQPPQVRRRDDPAR